MLTKGEILDNWNMFVGSQATNYGEDLTKNHDELWYSLETKFIRDLDVFPITKVQWLFWPIGFAAMYFFKKAFLLAP